MLYFITVYYPWVAAGLLWLAVFCLTKRRRGLAWLAAAALVGIAAHALHLAEWRRLEGQADRLYAWIVPLLMASAGWVCLVIGMLRQWSGRGDCVPDAVG